MKEVNDYHWRNDYQREEELSSKEYTKKGPKGLRKTICPSHAGGLHLEHSSNRTHIVQAPTFVAQQHKVENKIPLPDDPSHNKPHAHPCKISLSLKGIHLCSIYTVMNHRVLLFRTCCFYFEKISFYPNSLTEPHVKESVILFTITVALL
ncbi:hypothetical protein CEXT_344551 [Caerostris extrusa]|uniref:Uncharacterized protein n=1 Tax=Caerostris extrusa TaxID=172846 RepID=A0AAV4MRU8_CAEEX|nr:hypothetical protein CEXT_344551 [Caerostris extrusa]